MSVKKVIKRWLPKKVLYWREHRLLMKNIDKTYAEAEKELDDKFEKKFGRKINWDNPTTYNEKINVAKLYGATDVKTMLTDKILAAEWVRGRVGDECSFIPLIATYNSVDEIEFAELPDRYVMKMNNDSGSVVICDEAHPITKSVKTAYRCFLQKRNYAYVGYEMQYKDIKPQIMIEKYMGGAIRDYKFQCFDGKCYSCRVDFDRFGNHTRNFYDKKWNLLPFNKGEFKNYPGVVRKPRNFDKMWKLAEKLSQGFDQVRVDFYDIDGVVYFGEMTFTNGAGLERFYPSEVDLKMGELWKLDMGLIRERRRGLLDKKLKMV